MPTQDVRTVSRPSRGVSDAAPETVGRGRMWFGLLVSAVSVAGCVWWALRQDAPSFPADASGLGLVGLSLVIYLAATLARGWRWDTILRHAGIGHRRRDAYGLTVVGYMGNAVLPARGGEVLRILLMGRRSGARRREVLGTVLPERLLDAAALSALFVVMTFAGIGGAPAGRAPAIVASVALVGGLVALVLYLRLRIAGRFAGFAGRVRPIAKASRLLLTRWGVGLFAASVGVWLAEAAIFWLVASSLDASLSLIEALLVVVLGSFLALVPAGPGYVGTYDAAMLFALAALDIRGGTGLSLVLLFRFVVFVPITITGLILMVTTYGGLGAMFGRDARAAELGRAPAGDAA